MSLYGAYLWYTLTTPAVFGIYYFIFFMSGVLLMVTSFLFVYVKTRASRVGMTVLTGLFGGIHFFLDITLFDTFMGVILFAWVAFGLLLAFAAFNWLLE